MRRNKNEFRLKNFKSFKNSESFNIAPITVLVGPNNSGKSSFLKFMDILNHNLKKQEKLFPFIKFYNDNTGKFFGRFSENLNKFSESGEFQCVFKNFLNDSSLFFKNGKLSLNDFFDELEEIDFNLNELIAELTYVDAGLSGLLSEFKLFGDNLDEPLLDISLNSNQDSYNLSLNVEYFFPSLSEVENTLSIKEYLDEVLSLRIKETRDQILLRTFQLLEELNTLQASKDFHLNPFKEGFLLELTYFKKPNSIKENEEEDSQTIEERYSRYCARKIVLDFVEPLFRQFFLEILINNLYQLESEKNIKWVVQHPLNQIQFSKNAKLYFDSWIKEFGIGEKFEIHEIDGVQFCYIVKRGKFVKLDEEGEGSQKIINLMLDVVKSANFNEERSPNFILSEPEKGLHPKLQSLFADFIVDLKKRFDANFIIETHSEYFIRKLQILIAKNEFAPSDAVINYFKSDHNLEKNEKRVYPINFLKDGRLDKEFGPGFYEETTELMKEHFMTLKSN